MINSFRGEHYFLSNFSPSEICIQNIKYPTVEHAYQAMKAINNEDRKLISNANTPKEAKRLGNTVVCREDWERVRLVVMRGLVFMKFIINTNLRKQLIDTGDEELIEGNWWKDTFWGVCNGVGENNLGKILMEIRKCLI